MGKIAFVFAGQGAQYPGMGQELAQCSPAAAQVFQQLDALRPGTSQQCFSGTEAELKETRNTQPCLYCGDLAAALTSYRDFPMPGYWAPWPANTKAILPIFSLRSAPFRLPRRFPG